MFTLQPATRRWLNLGLGILWLLGLVMPYIDINFIVSIQFTLLDILSKNEFAANAGVDYYLLFIYPLAILALVAASAVNIRPRLVGLLAGGAVLAYLLYLAVSMNNSGPQFARFSGKVLGSGFWWLNCFALVALLGNALSVDARPAKPDDELELD